MSSNLSEIVRQSIINANYDFEKVITDVANGLKQSGFFEKSEWKDMLVQCFGRIRLGLTDEEIQIYSSVLSDPRSDSSYEAGFANDLSGVGAVSTPYLVAIPAPNNNRPTRNKRSSTTLDNSTPRNTQKRMKKPTNVLDEVKVANILVAMKNTNWEQIVPSVNAKQIPVKYVNVFHKSKQLKPVDAGAQCVRSNENVAPPTVVDEIEATPRNAIKNRRNAVYKPAVKESKKITKSVKAGLPASVAKDTIPISSIDTAGTAQTESPNLQPTVSTNNAVQTNIPVRRTTRRQTQLNAAYSGSALTSDTERRTTVLFQRTSVLFTMIDALQFKMTLNTYNIFVAETNEKYDYVIAEGICRSPKFLSAVVCGKPIISIKWIHALEEKKVWLDPLHYLLKDEDGEKKYNFDLAATLRMANNKRLFEKYSILVTPKISIGPDSLKGVIFSGGGKFLKTTLVPRRGDEVICISDENDKNIWPRLQKKYPTLKKIISLDGFAKMIFQYTYDVHPADILLQI